jgi:hypothetical protein
VSVDAIFRPTAVSSGAASEHPARILTDRCTPMATAPPTTAGCTASTSAKQPLTAHRRTPGPSLASTNPAESLSVAGHASHRGSADTRRGGWSRHLVQTAQPDYAAHPAQVPGGGSRWGAIALVFSAWILSRSLTDPLPESLTGKGQTQTSSSAADGALLSTSYSCPTNRSAGLRARWSRTTTRNCVNAWTATATLSIVTVPATWMHSNRSGSLSVLPCAKGAVEVLQLPPGGGCSEDDPGAAAQRLVGTRSAKRALTTGGSAGANTPAWAGSALRERRPSTTCPATAAGCFRVAPSCPLPPRAGGEHGRGCRRNNGQSDR